MPRGDRVWWVVVSQFLLVGGPALVGGLAGDADTQRDISPAVALGTKPIDGCLNRGLEFAFQTQQLGEFFDVTGWVQR
jgi:hypothetical protein